MNHEKESALITGALLGFLGTDGQALRYELITKQSSLARSGMSVNKRERYVMAQEKATARQVSGRLERLSALSLSSHGLHKQTLER